MTTEAATINRKVVLKFPHQLIDQPIVCHLVKEYGLDVNILMARITPREEGLLVLELTGQSDAFERGVQYLEELGIDIQSLSQDIVRNEDRCIHCGACVTICPSGALTLDPKTRKVNFIQDKCIACELCVPGCPPRAMEVHY
mgnify:CR=1 FL=1